MGIIATTFASVYRDYVTDGVPSSGENDPAKSEIRGIGTLIESTLGTLSLGSVSVTKDTRAHLNADLAHAVDTVALVYADTTDANNDLYVKVGASGTGSWTLTNILHLAINGLTASAIASCNASASAAAASATAAAASASAASSTALATALHGDTLVGARAVAILPAAQAATVSGNNWTLPSAGATVPINITKDQLGDTTTIVNIVLEIVSGAAGTAFTFALGRWRNSSGTQIGSDVALTKTATSVSLASAQPAGAVKFELVVAPGADTICRFPIYQFGTPARPNTDAWFLSLLGGGIASNDPTPIRFTSNSSNWDPITGRVTVPATASGSFVPSVPYGVNDGDVLWVLFDSPLEPTTWLQGLISRYGAAGGGSGTLYQTQVLHLVSHRYACALFVQSTGGIAFYGPGWSWNGLGSDTYFENISLYVGPKPPFIEKLSAITLKGIRDEIDMGRSTPIITLADDSCGVSGTPQFLPDPGKDFRSFLGTSAKFQNWSIPGNTVAQSASTVGLLPIHVSVSGGVIAASTATVTITAWDQDPISSNWYTTPDYDGFGWICGVFGRITATFSGVTITNLYFTPVTAPLWPIDVPAGSKLILRASRKRKGGLTLFPLSSVNGVGGGFADAVAMADAIFAVNDPTTIAGFIGLTPSPYDTGASLLTPFVGKSYYSRLYNPNIMSAATVAEAMSLFGWTWAAGEATAWAAGNIGIPGSMRWPADNFHPYTDVAAYVLAKNHFISAPVTAYLETWA